MAIPIAMDIGIRSGADIIKAIALSADLAVIGRLALYGIFAGGEPGHLDVHGLLRQEMVTILAQSGQSDVADLDRTALIDAHHNR